MEKLIPKILRTRPRLFFAAIIIFVMAFFLPHDWPCATRWLVAWDSGISLYLVLIAHMMNKSVVNDIRKNASEDEGKMVISLLTIVTVIASLVAIIAELGTAKKLVGFEQGEHIALAGITVFLSWCFMQTMFALHYAHEFYDINKSKQNKGLEFPGTDEPDYWDFIYFSFIIGTAAQTADVNITSKRIRRLTTLQCLIVFFFNVMILALMVNIGAGLF